MRSTRAVRLVVVIGLPASVGLMLIAHPLTELVFLRRAFTADDAVRTARMIACYSSGVWAYFALQILTRGFYALGDRMTPVKLGAAMVALNVVLNLTLIWVIAEAGLAVATAVCAGLQSCIMLWLLAGRLEGFAWPALGRVAWRTVVATSAMALVCVAALAIGPVGDGLTIRLTRVALPVFSGAVVYLIACRVLGIEELRWVMRGGD